MNKPINTWTQTFYKLGYTLRRIWHDEQDCSNNYTPLAIEVLEDRQMLSGFGGDDPMGGGDGDSGNGSGQFDGPNGGGGGSNTGGGGIIGGSGDSGPNGGLNGPGSGNQSGYSDSVYLTISNHWYSGIPSTNYAWNNPGTILGYDGQHAAGTTSGSFRTAEVTTADADLGLYFVTLATYQWTITVTASDDSGPAMTGGPSAWYREHLSVTVSGDIIETTNLQIASDFKTTGSIANHSGGFTVAGHIVSASTAGPGSGATYTYYVTKDSAGHRDKIEVDLHENLETTINRTTSLDSLLDRSGYTGMDLTVSGSVQVEATSKYMRTTDYESNKTSTGGRSFELNGSEESEIDYKITFLNASLVKQTTGYTPVTLGPNLAEQRRPKLDSNGNEVPRPSEGLRFAWEMNGNKSWESKLTHEYAGNGTFTYVGDNWIRVGEITSQYDEVSKYNNNYNSTVQRDETMWDVSKLHWIDNFGNGGYEYVKIADSNPPYQYVVLHSRSVTTDKSKGETKTMYALKRAYLNDGKVRTTTENVMDEGNAKPSFVRENHDPDLKTNVTSAELAVSNSVNHDQTDFIHTSEAIHLLGNWNRTSVYNTTNEASQIEQSPAGFTGTVTKTGTKNLTTTYDSQSIDSRSGWKNEFSIDSGQTNALDAGGDSNANAGPVGESTLVNILNSTAGTTSVDAANYNFQYQYAANGTVVVTDNSTITSHTTRLTSTDIEKETTVRNTAKDGITVSYNSESNNNTTVTGQAINGGDAVQSAWNSPGLQAVKSAMVGEATHVIRNTTTTYTPIPGADDDSGVAANALGENTLSDKYEIDISGTETLIQLSKIKTTTVSHGFKISDTGEVGGGQDGESPHQSLEFSHVTWNHTNSVEVTDSSTYRQHDYANSQSYNVEVTGTKRKNAKIDGVSSVLKLDVIQTGAASSFGSEFGIDPFDPSFKSAGSTFDVSAGWQQARDGMANGNPSDFPSDFLISMSVESRKTTEETRDDATHEFNYTAYYEMGLVPAEPDNSSSNNQASASVSENGGANGDMVPGHVEVARIGRVIETAKSSNKSWDNGFDFKYRISRTSTGTYHDTNDPGSGQVEFAYSFARTDLAPDQANMTQTLTGKKSTIDHGTYVNGAHQFDGVVTTKIEGVGIEGLDGGGMKTSTSKLQTRQNEIMTKKWENDLSSGDGQITSTYLVSMPLDGPNYSETESATISFNNFQTIRTPVAPAGGSSNNQNGSNNQSGPNNQTGGSSQTSGSGGSGQSSQKPKVDVAAQFDKIRDNLAKRSKPEPGIDVIGTTVTSGTSSFKFAERWQREVKKVFAFPQDSIYQIGAFFESSSAERTTTNNKSTTESVTFLAGASYTINQLDDNDKTEITWNDHVHDRHFHSQEFSNQVTPPDDVPSRPSGHTGTGPAPLLPAPPSGATLFREYISHMNYDSPENSIMGETKSELAQPFTYNAELNNKILYKYTRTLAADAHAEAMIRTTEYTGATFTSTKTEFTETNSGETTETRQMHAGATGGFVESVEYNQGTGLAVRADIVVLRRAEFNYIVTPQGTVSLVPQPIYVYSSGKPTFFNLSDGHDQNLLIHVKEFAGLVASNETGFAPSQSPPAFYPSDGQTEGQSAGDSNDMMKSITKIIELDLNGENALAFGKAFAAGFFYDGLWGTLTMLWDTAAWGIDALSFAGTYVVSGSDAAFNTDFGQGVIAAGQSSEQAVYSAMEFGDTFYAVASDLPKLLGITAGALSNETQQVLDQVNVILQELLPQILAELAEIPQQEKAAILGQIAGMVTFEIALSVGVGIATAGASVAVSAAAAAGKLCKWARKLNSLLPKPIAKRILPLIAKYIGCFEAETIVTNYAVQGDLANVTLAATANLELPSKEDRFLSDGQWAAVGLGLVVALSCRALSRKSQTDQDAEDDPWKVQYHYAV